MILEFEKLEQKENLRESNTDGERSDADAGSEIEDGGAHGGAFASSPCPLHHHRSLSNPSYYDRFSRTEENSLSLFFVLFDFCCFHAEEDGDGAGLNLS